MRQTLQLLEPGGFIASHNHLVVTDNPGMRAESAGSITQYAISYVWLEPSSPEHDLSRERLR
jgi:hypothetical protein